MWTVWHKLSSSFCCSLCRSSAFFCGFICCWEQQQKLVQSLKLMVLCGWKEKEGSKPRAEKNEILMLGVPVSPEFYHSANQWIGKFVGSPPKLFLLGFQITLTCIVRKCVNTRRLSVKGGPQFGGHGLGHRCFRSTSTHSMMQGIKLALSPST